MGFYYKKVFIGLILILLDFNIMYNGISLDIIPDFIGYFMIASFFKEVPKNEYNTGIAYGLSIFLGVFEVIKIFVPTLLSNPTLMSLNTILGTVLSAINLGVYYFICKIIIDESRKYRNESLLSFGYTTWYLTAFYSVSFMILSPFLLNYSLPSFFAIVIVVASFLEIVFLLLLTYKAHKNLPHHGTLVE